MNINFITDYTAEYCFGPKSTKNIAAYQLELYNSNEKEKIRDFFRQLDLDFTHLYLLTYRGYGLFCNKITEKKKIWGLYPDMKFPEYGDTYRYEFPSGIVFASHVRLDSDSLDSGIELLMKNYQQSVIIYSPMYPLQKTKIQEFFDCFFEENAYKNGNPSVFFLDFNEVISRFCSSGNKVFRYAADGDSSEICGFFEKV